MAKDPRKRAQGASIVIQRRDDFNFELVEVKEGAQAILITEVYPIVLEKAIEWLQKEAGVL